MTSKRYNRLLSKSKKIYVVFKCGEIDRYYYAVYRAIRVNKRNPKIILDPNNIISLSSNRLGNVYNWFGTREKAIEVVGDLNSLHKNKKW